MKQFYYLLFCILLLGTTFSYSQSKVVTGRVLDEGGELLVGVSVYIKGTTNGTITNVDGKYVIQNVSSRDTLVFSYIGYNKENRHVGNLNIIDVILNKNNEELEEVQIVAFQKQKKESVIGSINTIKPAELKQPTSNLTNTLAGRIAGVISYQRSGEPGADNSQFFIRGVTSFGYKNNPLILLDGFEITSSDLARIEPDNIASFSIMKDATATSLYGARGANGVILITTKEGTKGKVKISVRLESSVATPTMTNDFLDGVKYMEMYNIARRTRNNNSQLKYSKEKIENTRNKVNKYIYPNVNWYDDMFKDYTFNKKANLNMNGGGEIARYYLSVSYTNETGLLKVDKNNNFNNNIDINRYNLRANIDINITKTTVGSAKFYSLFNKYNGPSTSASDLFNDVMQANPVSFPKYFPKTDATSYLKHTLFGNEGNAVNPNPYAKMVSGFKDEFSSTLLSQFKIEQDFSFITEGLSARAMASIKNYSTYGSNSSYKPYFYEAINYDSLSGAFDVAQIQEGTEYLQKPVTSTYANSRVYFEIAGIYNRTFDKHSVGGLLVYTQEERLNTIANPAGYELFASLPARNMGLAGRATYGYDSRYFLELNFGYNGSERFSKDNRFGFFPSVGIGWSVSNEKFWTVIKPVVNQFKIKATYGKVGNDAIAADYERFMYLSNVTLSDNNKGYSWGEDFGNFYPGATVNQYANPNVTWEVAKKLNCGVELGFIDKFTLQADYFMENRSNIYMENKNIPYTMGLSANIKSNLGEVKSHGVDASLDYQQSFMNSLWLSARANFTYATNEIVVNGEPVYPYDYMSRIGHSIDQQWGLVAERLFVDDVEVANSPAQTYSSNYMAGDIKYVDVNNDGKVDDNDMVPIGYPRIPEIVYGFGVSAGYKNFDFSFFFQGSARSSFFIDPSAISPFVKGRNALNVIADDHWSTNNPNPFAFWPRLSDKLEKNNTVNSTWWLRDGSFLRLKSVELGYTLPKDLITKIKLKNLRVYFSGNNLLTFSKFKLWDPEMSGNGLGYPPQMIINAGIIASF